MCGLSSPHHATEYLSNTDTYMRCKWMSGEACRKKTKIAAKTTQALIEILRLSCEGLLISAHTHTT
ncbi:hypothetical protein M406DRAFT_100537 [Cryphonectria parasitica EP155]|uniref:Uncharacterized protein n=1 Tax=Cryphonectria parasitica (strain ATCC 38755 / EP155) TaxID=660469 RepID=A0A9P4YA84_CRYP1|nr:uncharacterized protein M406DRAFT_100537 [Cryphonectria parasitica EP155]KAF3769636.1 hypothetical protein M406DRAFT_100537 [Cryphonectria parasitica EP155]